MQQINCDLAQISADRTKVKRLGVQEDLKALNANNDIPDRMGGCCHQCQRNHIGLSQVNRVKGNVLILPNA